MSESMSIELLVQRAHSNARIKGFWEDWDALCSDDDPQPDEFRNNAIATRIMLIVSELSEALEALRSSESEAFNEELADAAIRLADLSGGLGIDLGAEIRRKMVINEHRPYRHGKRF